MPDYNTIALMTAYKEAKKPQLFLRDRYFKNVRTFNQNTVEVDIVRKARRMSSYVTRGGIANPVKQKGFKTYSYQPPLLSDSHKLTVAELNQRIAGEDVYSPLTPAARLQVARLNSIMEMSESFDRTEEYQCMEALFNAEISVSNGDTVSFPMSDNMLDVAVDTDWSDADADILGDLEAGYMRVLKASGEAPDELVLGSTALEGFLANTAILALLDNRNFNIGVVAPQNLPQGATFIMKLTWKSFSLNVISYNAWYDVDGTDTAYIPAKKALLISSGARRDRLYGAVEANDNYVAVDRYADTWVEKNPDGTMVRLQSAPLMAPFAIDTWTTIQAIA